MLRFFRSIRQQLLNENKTVRYLKYAVGEILLIMIGIFLALQLNNWNQERLDRIEERYLLIELMENLDQEAERLEIGSSVLNDLVERLVAIRHYLEGSSTDHNDFEANLGRIHTSFRYTPVTSAYETTKGSGKGFSDRDLKAILFQYYDIDQPMLMGGLDRRRNQIINHLMPLLSKHLKSFDLGTYRAVPKNMDDPKFRDDVLGQLIYLHPETQRILDLCTSLLESNREIRAFLEQELAN